MSKKPALLVSACLMGVQCRYDGGGMRLEGLERLMDLCAVIPVCPEQLGGLPTPRTPSERVGDRVMSREGRDMTDAFSRGARQACVLASLYGARLALLKTRSPSCGAGTIYDGSFTGRVVPGSGVTAQALAEMGVAVYTEENIETLFELLIKENAK